MNVSLPSIVATLAKYEETNHTDLVSSSIITALGGVTRVIQLCLTHPDSIGNNQYHENALSSLHQIMNNAHTSVPSSPVSNDPENNTFNPPIFDNDIVINGDIDTLQNTTINAIQRCESPDSPSSRDHKDIKFKRLNININNTHNDNHQTKNMSISNYNNHPDAFRFVATNNNIIVHAHNISQFYKSAVVLNADICNNYFYNCTWLSDSQANWCMNLILYNKWYSIIMTFAAFILATASQMDRTINKKNTVSSLVLSWMSCIVGSILTLSLMGVMNLDIIKIATNTFDFWFKMWNLLMWNICCIWIYFETTNDDRQVSELIAPLITVSGAVINFSLMDAMPLKYKLKKIIVAAAVCFYFGFFIRSYFFVEDVYYNPFGKYNFKHTQISLKSTFLGAYLNIALFVGKPVLTDISKWCVGKLCKCIVVETNTSASKETQVQHERLFSIYKRPKVKWNSNDLNKDIKLNSTS